MRTLGLILTIGLFLQTDSTHAQNEDRELSLLGSMTSSASTLAGSYPNLATPMPPERFGSKGTSHIMLGSTVAHDFGDNTDINLHAQWTTFIAEDFEIGVEGGIWAIFQKDDTVAVSASAVMRYHFYQGIRFSFFAEIGLGIMGAGDTVPDMGTGFNFMPRLGGGLTYALDDSGSTRLITGLRWHHISNARIHGEARNPSRDAPGFYAGVLFEF